MRTSKRNIITLLLSLFMWSQVFSLCGALESFNANSLDDIDPEQVVTLDPFLASTEYRISQGLEALHQAILSGCASLLQAFLQHSELWLEGISFIALGKYLGTNRLWLLQRRLLI